MGQYFEVQWGSLPHGIIRYFPTKGRPAFGLWGSITETHGEAIPTASGDTTPKRKNADLRAGKKE